MHSLLQDLRFSLRLLYRTPAFAVSAIAVLALGIGANTAVFSLVDELLWTPRPYVHPEQIVQLYSQDKRNPENFRSFSYPTYRDIAAQNTVFSGVMAHAMAMVSEGEGEATRRSFAAVVSSNYFSVLGVRMARGRAFLPEEEAPASNAAVVIASYAYWKRMDYDPELVGKTIRVNERLFTVIGITPSAFTGTMMLLGPELYFPLGVYDAVANGDALDSTKRTLERRTENPLFLVGRLKPGVTLASANAALKGLAANLERSFPVEQKDQTFFSGPLPRLSTSVAPPGDKSLSVVGTLLIGMAAIVLLIACLNLANLLLARGHARRKEIAVRLALGAARHRIVRQLLTEGSVLAAIGGAAGLVFAIWGMDLLVGSITSRFPLALFFRGAGNPAMFAATLGFCALATVGFAMGPALRLTRAASVDDLKQQAGEDASAQRRRWRWLPRHPLVMAQIALSLGLLVTAGLFVRGALKAASVDTGFRADHTIMAEVDASLGGYDQARTLQAYRAINERLAAVPGVETSAIGSVVPFGMVSMEKNVRRAGIAVAAGASPARPEEGRAYVARWSSVGVDYFKAMGLPMLRGRPFTAAETDQPGAPAVAIVDEVLARSLFPDGDALGQRIDFKGGEAASATAEKPGADPRRAAGLEIVGIVPATRWSYFDPKGMGAVYVPFAQGYASNVFFHVRATAGSADRERALIDTIRREIRTSAPVVPVFAVKTYAQHLDTSLQLWIVRMGAVLFGLFGALALVLATLGIYGVKSYAVSRRTREIGIRVALGAEPGTVHWMILREGLATTALGVAGGLLLGLGFGKVCAGMLYDVSATDPLAFAVAPLILGATALVACWVPARRATRVNPMVALRTD